MSTNLVPCLKTGCVNRTPYDPASGRRCCDACKVEARAATPAVLDVEAIARTRRSTKGGYHV